MNIAACDIGSYFWRLNSYKFWISLLACQSVLNFEFCYLRNWGLHSIVHQYEILTLTISRIGGSFWGHSVLFHNSTASDIGDSFECQSLLCLEFVAFDIWCYFECQSVLNFEFSCFGYWGLLLNVNQWEILKFATCDMGVNF